jgi:hypothetical protein
MHEKLKRHAQILMCLFIVTILFVFNFYMVIYFATAIHQIL